MTCKITERVLVESNLEAAWVTGRGGGGKRWQMESQIWQQWSARPVNLHLTSGPLITPALLFPVSWTPDAALIRLCLLTSGLSQVNNTIQVNSVDVPTSDLMATNGVIHVVKNVLYPPGEQRLHNTLQSNQIWNRSAQIVVSKCILWIAVFSLHQLNQLLRVFSRPLWCFIVSGFFVFFFAILGDAFATCD